MKALVRSTMIAAALVMVAATVDPLLAQGRQKEIRLDMLALETSDGTTGVTAAFPGSVAIGFYMNENVAIEPQVGIAFVSGDGFSGSVLSAGLFVPFYLAGDSGHSGFFISPGLSVSKGTGDLEFDAAVDYGVDLGMKMTRNERVSTRLALTLRDGDSSTEAVIGAAFGIGLFWR